MWSSSARCSLGGGKRLGSEPDLLPRSRSPAIGGARISPTRLKFHDAAIGGTGSQLGVFRLDRDVLAHRPDLVFLDFSANDDIYSDNPETLASYEAIVRRLVVEAACPVVQVIFPFKWDVARKTTDGMKRRDAHLAISRAYQTAVGDAIALAIARVGCGAASLDGLWPIDGVHPGDEGYVLFATRHGLRFKGPFVTDASAVSPHRMLFGEACLHSVRMPLRKLGPLPAGCAKGSRTSTRRISTSSCHDGWIALTLPPGQRRSPARTYRRTGPSDFVPGSAATW